MQVDDGRRLRHKASLTKRPKGNDLVLIEMGIPSNGQVRPADILQKILAGLLFETNHAAFLLYGLCGRGALELIEQDAFFTKVIRATEDLVNGLLSGFQDA